MAQAAEISIGRNAPKIGNEHYAGFWVRFLSVCIDLLLCAPIYYGIRFVFDLALAQSTGVSMANATVDFAGTAAKPHELYQWWFESGFAILVLALYAGFFSSKWQGSPGMHLLKFRITDIEGRRIGFKRGLLWCVTSVIIWVICFAGIAYLQSRFDLSAIAQIQFSCLEQNIAPDDCLHEIESITDIPFTSFLELIYASLALFLFLALIWALSIALPRDKTGFHNLICGTRFLTGRP